MSDKPVIFHGAYLRGDPERMDLTRVRHENDKSWAIVFDPGPEPFRVGALFSQTDVHTGVHMRTWNVGTIFACPYGRVTVTEDKLSWERTAPACTKAPFSKGPKEHTCPVCGTVFTSNKPRHTYCTPDCAAKADKINTARWHKEHRDAKRGD